jgi:hypothetical protein
MAGKHCVSRGTAYLPKRLSDSEPLRTEAARARNVGHVVLGVCGAIALMVLVIVGARLRSGGSMAPLSLAMPAVALAWLAVVGLRTLPRQVQVAPTAGERPSRRPPRFEAGAAPRTDRPSDSGRHANA